MLPFRDIKQNYPVYIFNKQSLTIEQGKVTQLSFPRVDSGRMPLGNMVVDVTISSGGKTATYTIPENLCITDAGPSLVLSTEKETLTHEVEAMKNNALQILATVDRQKEIVAKTDELLAELSPALKDKAQYEERFKNIESGMSDIKNLLESLIGGGKESKKK